MPDCDSSKDFGLILLDATVDSIKNWWMFHLTLEKGRILQGLVYSLASFLHVESHARVGLESFELLKQGSIQRPPCIECFCKPDFDHFSQHCLS